MPPLVLRALIGLCALVPAVVATIGCDDPCVALAERICQCQEDPTERIACRQERITNQRDQRTVTDEDRSRCTAALDTCDCVDLDQNRTDQCGFAPEGPP